eukprot:2930074-Rhodomonas_salina.5
MGGHVGAASKEEEEAVSSAIYLSLDSLRVWKMLWLHWRVLEAKTAPIIIAMSVEPASARNSNDAWCPCWLLTLGVALQVRDCERTAGRRGGGFAARVVERAKGARKGRACLLHVGQGLAGDDEG